MADSDAFDADARKRFADGFGYGGNPEHKRYPNDYGLTPPSSPRPGKTLCDAIEPFPKKRAEELLRDGFLRGLLSKQCRNGWPQNVWAVFSDDLVFEGQLENKETGIYHGYPMPTTDDFRDVVLKEWRRRE
ncbi:MAG: hypothetical protein JRH20_28265 [Deltaproteobacteria bacterium]|nr:hypothetical protein [Deltaproteobacteria bacterium]